jgi:MIZ/SP-RING zinc finger
MQNQNNTRPHPQINPEDTVAARRLAESNATTNYFLGAIPRPWMIGAHTVPSIQGERCVTLQGASGDSQGMRNGAGHVVSHPAGNDPSGPSSNRQLGTMRSASSHDTPRLNTSGEWSQAAILSPSSVGSPATLTASPTATRMQFQGSRPVSTPQINSVAPSLRKRSIDVANAEVEVAPFPARQQQSHLNEGASTVPPTAIPMSGHLGRPMSHPQQLQHLLASAHHSLNSFPQPALQDLDQVQKPRTALLKNACAQNDPFYLCMHQIFCLFSLNPSRILQTGFGEAQRAGLNVLSLVLLSNGDLSPPALEFFSELPMPIEKLMDRFGAYRSVLNQVGVFLQNLALGWDPMREKCFARKYPPFAEELVDDFGLHSPVLQRVLFNSIHRQLGTTENAAWNHEALKLFDLNQNQHLFRMRNCAGAGARSRSLVAAEQKLLGEQYKSLRNEAANLVFRRPSLQSLQTTPLAAPLSMPTAPTQVPPNCFPSPYSGTSPSQILDSQYTDWSLQRVQMPAPSMQPRSTSNASTNPTATSNLSNESFPTTTAHQMYNPLVPLHSMPMSTHLLNQPRTVHVAGQAEARPQPVRRRGRPPLGTRPMMPHSPRSLELPSSRGGRGGRADYLALHSPANRINTYPLFLPAPGEEPIQTTIPNPNRLALHQAHLRSPVAEKVDLAGKEAPDARLYQYLAKFASVPKVLDPESSILRWEFSIGAADIAKKAAGVTASEVQMKRVLADGCFTYRLRSVEVGHGVKLVQEAEWSVRDMSWPPSCFVRVNDVNVELRRKLHHGKDLPVDLTSYIHEGMNAITVALLHDREGKRQKCYAMAVEVVEVANQARIDAAPTIIAAEDSLRSITQGLAGHNSTGTSEDDEIQILDPHISIDIVDPFMATIFEIPARGRTCYHRECFDLQTFFQTRKSRTRDAPTSPDEWKCPICKKDARPQSLIVDCFLKTVRDSLVSSGAPGEAKAILIKGDGSWRVKKETMEATRTREESNTTVVASPATSKGTVRGSVSRSHSVVIEINDD